MNEITAETAETESSKIVKDAQFASNITDATSYQRAGDMLIRIRQMRKKWESIINPIKSDTYKAWKNACSKEKEVDAPFAEAESVLHSAMSRYYQDYEIEKKKLENNTNPENLMILPSLEKVPGLTTIETWSAEVDSLIDLIKAVAEGRAPMVCLEANTKFLNQQARALKEEFKIPGCKSIKKTGYQVRFDNGL